MNLTKLGRGLRRLLHDERGAEGLEKLLIIGAIVLPLLGVLIFFREQLTDLLTRRWSDIEGDMDPPPFQP
jgi:Flp pilus assembly pilin Flp